MVVIDQQKDASCHGASLTHVVLKLNLPFRHISSSTISSRLRNAV